ncbi:MAG: vWA domain-containing protein, partial [Planctomycetota bacterium]
MSGFFRNPRVALVAALLLAVAGALGWGWPVAPGDPPHVLVDRSASCHPPGTSPPGSVAFDDSRLLDAIGRAVAAGAGRVRLYTDGCDLDRVTPAALAVPVEVVLRPRRDQAILLDLRAPDVVDPGQSFAVQAEIGRTEGDATGPRSFAVRLTRDGERIGRTRSLELARGQRRTVSFVDRVPTTGSVRYRCELDGAPARELYVQVGRAPRIAVAGPAPDWPGFRFFPLDATTPFDAALVREPIRSQPVRAHLERALRGGAGLLASSSWRAPLLPLTETPPAGRAVVLLIDISGSMEPHLPDLVRAYGFLLTRLDPDDRVLLLRFRDGVIDASAWKPARDSLALWKNVRPQGPTQLGPALREAAQRLAEVGARARRLYVVSDGAWEEDLALPEALGDVERAALFVTDDVPAHAKQAFPRHAVRSGAWEQALVQLEEEAPDRRVRDAVEATTGTVPGWLRGALPATRVFRDFPRLYPRGLGESIALAAGSIPIVAAREEGGRIVQVAPPALLSPALLRAVLTDRGALRLRARRVGLDVEVEAFGAIGGPLVWSG